jgi:hypothetical protein
LSRRSAISYSDTTPAVTNIFDRFGRSASVICNGMTDTLAYNTANQLLSETFTGGTLAGLAVTNGFDPYLRRTNLAALQSNNPLIQQSSSWDAASRLQSVTD